METQIEPLVQKQLGKVVNKIAQEQVENLLTKGKTSKTRSNDFDFDGDDDELDMMDADVSDIEETELNDPSPFPEDEAEKILRRVEAKEAFDIFTDIGEYWEKKGLTVRYDINKNNKLLTKKDHPYTWEDLQKEYGGGNYKVMARLPQDGNKYLRCQTRSIHNAPEQSPDFIVKNLIEKQKTMEEKGNQSANITEILEMMRRNNEAATEQANRLRRESLEMAERARLEAKEEARNTLELYEKMMEKNKPTQPDLLTQLTPLLTAVLPKLLEKPAPQPVVDNSKQQFDMMMKIQAMNMDMMKEQAEATREMFKTMQESIKELAKEKKSSGTGDAIDPLKMYSMLKEAESSGFEQMRMLNELAKEQALEREELRGERDPEPKEKESTVDMLIKNLLPVIAGRVVAPPAQPQIAAPSAPIARPVHSNPAQRGAVSKNINSNRPVENRTTGTKVSTTETRTATEVSRTSQTGSQPSERTLGNMIINDTPMSVLDIKEEPVALVREVAKEEILAVKKLDNVEIEENQMSLDHFLGNSTEPEFRQTETVKVEEIKEEVKLSTVRDQANTDKILTIVVPIAVDGYMASGSTIEGIADNTISELKNQGIDLATVERDFDDETLSAIIVSLPEDLQTLTKDLRNVIIEKIRIAQ